MNDFYDVLDISPAATAAEVKSAYRHLAREYHPDNFPGDDASAGAHRRARRRKSAR